MSIYVPTERAGPETRQNRIRLKNALDEAASILEEHAIGARRISTILEAPRALIDDHAFWQRQEDGLAVFAAPGRSEWYRVPIDLDEVVVVTGSFHVKPLLRTLIDDASYAVLALSRGRIRLYGCTRDRVGEITLPSDVPTSLDDALWYLDQDRHLQHHASDRVGTGTPTATFHGHGTPDEKADERDRAFLRAVDRAVTDLVGPRRLLVPAGVEEIVSAYRSVTDHPRVTDDAVIGNPEWRSEQEMHDLAWEIVGPHLRSHLSEDAEIVGTARSVVGVADTVRAASVGRAAAAFVAGDTSVWGRVVPERDEVVIHDEPVPGDRDLLDVAAVGTWDTGGRVHIVPSHDVPGGELAAAVLRY